ncbi:MAG: phospho-N-acetylmuramoyl-pentapeptide-transferase [Lachnospiraceae bacterium]|jgi:phospho-N-acetylmuramoyl-pentapeptide-transferase
MSTESVVAMIVSCILSAVLVKFSIPVLHRLKFGQQVRTDGPQEHLKKQGTPTMGGCAFLAALTAVGIILAIRHPEIWAVLLLTLGFGLTGFIDDFLKIKKQQSEGFNPKQKLAVQIVFTALFCWYCMASDSIGTRILIPFSGGKTVDLSWFYVPFLFLAVLGTDNGVNFSDGLDGLCASVSIPVALFFMFAAAKLGNGVSPFGAAMAGVLLGFLLFNAYPAKLFMGDTGSLAIGGFVAGMACVLRMPLYILIAGLIYLIEVVSVIIQVVYFKKTHGKRFFRMAPIHHHFELGGWSETRVVTVFTAATILLCLVAWLGL